MEKLLTTKEVAKIFGVTERTITQKFIKEGLKYFPIGSKDFRFSIKDIEEFIELKKEIAENKVIEINPINKRARSKAINIDYQKRKINIEQLKVV